MLTPATFGLFTDVMTALPDASGLQLGQVCQIPNTNQFVQLLQNNAVDPLPDGAVLSVDEDFLANLADSAAVVTAVATAVNDMTGATVPINAYFWGKVKGETQFLADNTVVDGDLVVPGATPGVLTPGAAGNVEQRNLLALETNGGPGDAIISGRIL